MVSVMQISTRKFKRWQWEIGARYWQMRRSLLEWVFAHLNSVRCWFATEQRSKEPPEPDAVVRALGKSDQYLGEGSYRRFSLKRGQSTLATLVEYTGDFPWLFCHCTPTLAFEAVRPEFEEFSRAAHAMGTPEGYQAWRRALRRVRRLGLKLVPLELPRMQGPYPTLLYIDGDKARFRMSSSQNVTLWPW